MTCQTLFFDDIVTTFTSDGIFILLRHGRQMAFNNFFTDPQGRDKFHSFYRLETSELLIGKHPDNFSLTRNFLF